MSRKTIPSGNTISHVNRIQLSSRWKVLRFVGNIVTTPRTEDTYDYSSIVDRTVGVKASSWFISSSIFHSSSRLSFEVYSLKWPKQTHFSVGGHCFANFLEDFSFHMCSFNFSFLRFRGKLAATKNSGRQDNDKSFVRVKSHSDESFKEMRFLTSSFSVSRPEGHLMSLNVRMRL